MPSAPVSSGCSKSLAEPKANSPDPLNANAAASAPPAFDQTKSPTAVSASDAVSVATEVDPSATAKEPALVITGTEVVSPASVRAPSAMLRVGLVSLSRIVTVAVVATLLHSDLRLPDRARTFTL